MADVGEAPLVRTSRLVLRAWRGGDRDAFADMNADPRVVEHLVGPVTRDDSHDMVDRIEVCWRDLGYGLWAVERRDHGCFVGYVGLWPATFDAPFTPAVEVGWRLAGDHWGQGFATEGGRAALRYGFEVVGLAEIVSFTAVGNVRSWRVMERLGMQRDEAGDFEHPSVPVGHPARPHVLYRLGRGSWAARGGR
ncbi:MAG: GNAT family N-acetyltransferase [Actinomycetota bacterium]|nr:GNAT family N-acetyltransferase [Actinomycetota bacterium]